MKAAQTPQELAFAVEALLSKFAENQEESERRIGISAEVSLSLVVPVDSIKGCPAPGSFVWAVVLAPVSICAFASIFDSPRPSPGTRFDFPQGIFTDYVFEVMVLRTRLVQRLQIDFAGDISKEARRKEIEDVLCSDAWKSLAIRPLDRPNARRPPLRPPSARLSARPSVRTPAARTTARPSENAVPLILIDRIVSWQLLNSALGQTLTRH